MGLQPISPPRRLTALQHVQRMYVRGETTVEKLEQQVEWLMKNRLDDSFQHISATWPPEPGSPDDSPFEVPQFETLR